MIEAHHSHLIPRMRSSDLSGKEMGEFAGVLNKQKPRDFRRGAHTHPAGG